MITFENMDAVWAIIGHKKGNEKPTNEELETIDDKDLRYRIKESFNKVGKWEDMDNLLRDYWKIKGKKDILNYVEAEKRSKRPQNVVIDDIYYSRYGEPIKKGDKVTWHSLFGKHSGILRDFTMICSSVGYGVKVICFVEDKDRDVHKLNDGRVFNIDGINGNKYFDDFLECPCREYL